ncbi:MAG TPA: hypothetical protein VIJ27_03915 [Mucilaginibacter sp.]
MVAYTDYLIVISPPESVINEVSRYKRSSVNVIGHYEGMHNTAQIVITRQTRCNPLLVQPIIECMAKRLSIMPPIQLQINGFSFFNEGRAAKTIYAIIEHVPKTDNWFMLLKKQLGIKVKNFVPHIIIAKNIPATSFNELWPNFENRLWAETFIANSLTILHRETYVEYCEWRVYKELFFANRLKEMF